MDVVTTGLIEYAASAYTLPSELVSGDNFAVVDTAKGMLVAVVDGLGHGPEAAFAATAAVNALSQAGPTSNSLESLITHCHGALTQTRGAAMVVAEFDHQSNLVDTLCVGEVRGCLFALNEQNPRTAQQSVLLCPGLVGKSLPALQPLKFRVQRGDILVLATDGIASAFTEDRPSNQPIQDIAHKYMSGHCKQTDDALVLAVRYLG